MKKFFNWLDKTFVKPVEESKMSLGAFILIAAGYILARNLFEGAFESLHLIGLSSITLFGIEEMFLHLMFSWLYFFMIVAILLRFTTGHDMKKITRVLLAYSFIVLIPPFIDFLFMPGGFRLAYPTDISIVGKVIWSMLRPWILFNPRMVYEYSAKIPYGGSPGMIIEVFVALILIIVYSWIRTPSLKRRIIAVLLTPAILAATIIIAGGAQVLVSNIPGDPLTGKSVYFTGGLITSATRKYALIVLIPFLIVLFIGLLLYNKQKTLKLVKSIDPFSAILAAVAAGAGFLFAWLGLKDILTGVPRSPFDYVALFGLLVMGAASAVTRLYLSQSWSEKNSEEDKKTFRRGAWGMFILTLALGWSLGYANLFILLVSLVFGLVLAVPPLRLERWSVPSSLGNGLAVFMLVYCGYSLFATERTFSIFPWQLSIVVFATLWLSFLVRELIIRHKPKRIQTGEAAQ